MTASNDSFKVRLQAERDDLAQRTLKLDVFLEDLASGKTSAKVSMGQQRLLKRQQREMHAYLVTLEERISDLNKGDKN